MIVVFVTLLMQTIQEFKGHVMRQSLTRNISLLRSNWSQFLPRDAMLARYMLWLCVRVCVSVCLPVCLCAR